MLWTQQKHSLTSEIQDSEEISHKMHEKLQEKLDLGDELYESEDTTKTQNLTLVSETQDSEEISHKAIGKLRKVLNLLEKVYTSKDSTEAQNILESETLDYEGISPRRIEHT